jgi:iron complex outermembrane receptor protein
MITERRSPIALARLGLIAPALMGSLFAYTAAFAQSTGSQTAVTEVVITSKHVKSIGGLAVPVTAAKDESIVTQDFIKHQVGSSNLAQVINLLPGVTYSTEDPTGVLSSDFRLHGVPGDHVSFTFDGTPLNDTGNYAIYPAEYPSLDIVDHITVNIGQTEVDSPSASALGGTVNVVSKNPQTSPGATGTISGGSYEYRHAFAELDSGSIGPFGTRGYITGNFTNSDKYKGEGDLYRWGVDGKVYQPLKGTDFMSVGFTWVSERTYFYESDSLSQISQYGRSIDYNTGWAVPTAVDGQADKVPPAAASSPGFEQGGDSNFWKLHPNPVDFGDIRGQSRFELLPGVTLTVDPYLFYTLANGGGATAVNENDPRLIGSLTTAPVCPGGGSGVDLNHDGDCKDSVLLYSPSNTQTHRYGVNSSLIWDITPEHRVQLAYSLDYGRHRQTGEYTYINPENGTPDNVFGGRGGDGAPVVDADGSQLRKRDRFSIAQLNQVAFNYIGKFLDDKIHVNLGLRDPMFQRKLNEFCYVYNGTSEYCDTVSPALVQNALTADGSGVTGSAATHISTLLGLSIKYGANGLPNFRLPFKQTYNFNKVLPNTGVTYNFDDHNQIYVTYDQSFSAPKTDDLYSSLAENVQPETLDEYGAGYRYQGSSITASANLWYSVWKNHIVSSFDPNDPTVSIDRNVGEVHLGGLDFEGAWKINDAFSIYASGTIMKSSLQQDYQVTAASGPDAGKSVPLPVKGKELVLSPDQEVSLRGQYTVGPFVFGVQGKYESKRYLDDTNQTSVPGFATMDLDAQYNFNVGPTKTTLQINVYNLFGTAYYTRSTTGTNYAKVFYGNGDVVNAASGPFVYVGSPTVIYGTLKAQF